MVPTCLSALLLYAACGSIADIHALRSVEGRFAPAGPQSVGPTGNSQRERTRAEEQQILPVLPEDTDPPGLQLAVRQALLDYGTSVALDLLASHIHSIVIPPVNRTISVPVLGNVSVQISDVKCTRLQLLREAATVAIIGKGFRLAVTDVTVGFSYHWSWRYERWGAKIQGSGEGSTLFRRGALVAKFSLHDEGTLKLHVNPRRTIVDFVDIDIRVDKAPLKPLYDALLSVFHGQIVARITGQMNHALKHKVPKQINKLLAQLPSEVPVQNLPFQAAFKYALYTHGYVMIAGYPHFDLSRATDAPEQALSLHSGNVGSKQCPYKGSALPVTDAEILADSHMATGFVSDAVLQCFLWTLHQKGKLSAELRDGDLPNLRLITDLLPYLLPGIQKDYPHTSVAIDVRATAMPRVAFMSDTGMLVEASFDTDVYVLPGRELSPHISAEELDSRRLVYEATVERSDAERRGSADTSARAAEAGSEAAQQGSEPEQQRVGVAEGVDADRVLVAQLTANATLVANVGFSSTAIPQINVRYGVKDSKYAVDPAHWDSTVEWVAKAARGSLGLRKLYETFVDEAARKIFEPHDVATQYRDGWYQVSANVHVNASRLPVEVH